nr:hypothetical protein [uncultured Roseovarius sp.]
MKAALIFIALQVPPYLVAAFIAYDLAWVASAGEWAAVDRFVSAVPWALWVIISGVVALELGS